MSALLDVHFWTRRRAAVAGTLLAALSGALISYDALAAIARDAGVPWALSWLFPLGVDGLIAVATVGALEVGPEHQRARIEVWALLAIAIAVSVVGNAAHAGPGGPVLWGAITARALWSAVPAGAYAAALHLLVIIHRYGARAVTRDARAPAPPKRAPRGARIVPSARRRAPLRVVHDGREMSASHARKLRAKARAQGMAVEAA